MMEPSAGVPGMSSKQEDMQMGFGLAPTTDASLKSQQSLHPHQYQIQQQQQHLQHQMQQLQQHQHQQHHQQLHPHQLHQQQLHQLQQQQLQQKQLQQQQQQFQHQNQTQQNQVQLMQHPQHVQHPQLQHPQHMQHAQLAQHAQHVQLAQQVHQPQLQHQAQLQLAQQMQGQTQPQPQMAQPQPQLQQQTVMTKDQLYQLKAQIVGYKYIFKNLPLPQQVITAIKQGANIANHLQQQQLLQQQQQQQQQQLLQSQSQVAGQPMPHLQQSRAYPIPVNNAGLTPNRPQVDQRSPVVRMMMPSSSNMSAGVPVPINSGKPMMTLAAPAQYPVPNTAQEEAFPPRVDAIVLMEGRERMVQVVVSNKRETTVRMLSKCKSEDNADEELFNILSAEQKCTNLLDLQRKLRQQVVDEYFKIQPLPTSEDDSLMHDLMSDRSRRNRPFSRDNKHSSVQHHRFAEDLDTTAKYGGARLQLFINSVLQHSKEFKEYHTARQLRVKKMAKTVLAHHNNQEKREMQRREKQERERLRALKANDEEAYMQLLEETKNERLNELLNQTNEYLRRISALVQKSKESHMMGDDEELVLFPEIQGGESSAKEGKATETEPGAEKTSTEETKTDTPAASKPTNTNTYYTSAHSIQEQIGAQPELLDGGELKPYQLKGLQWLVSLYNNKLNGILADEMGLGKTIQTIALVAYLMEKKMNSGPYLIVVPLSTLSNWNMEFEKWAPKIVRVCYKGAPRVRKDLYDAHIYTGKFNVVLTTYEYIMKDKSSLSKVKWNYIIIDEGHRMKNHNCKLSNILGSAYSSRHRLLLTGTPLQNSLPELWSLLNFLLPSIFDCVESFEQWFNAPFSNAIGGDVEMNEEEKLLIIHRLHKVLRPFLLRRLKNEVENQLPEKTEKVLKCEMSAMQRRMYSLMHDKGVMRTGPTSNTKGLMNTLMQLRKICNHPYLFREDGGWLLDDDLIRSSGKFELLDRIFPKLMATGHRVLIFSQMTSLLTILEDYFNYRKILYLRLDGSTKADERGTLLEKFNAPNSPFFVFVLSTRAGGLGLNLQTADTVILFDSDWNPQIDLQAQDRAHRIGQTNEVRVLRLVCENSIEERILARANFKLDIDAKIIQAGKFDNKSSAQDRRDMLEYLMTKEEGIVENEVVPNDEEINEMLARTDDEFDLFQKMDAEREEARSRTSTHRLMQEDELPAWLLEDPTVGSSEDISLVYGRGFRDRPKVDYDDGLTDKQWERKLIEYDEGSVSPPPSPTTPKRKRSKTTKNEEDASEYALDEEDTPKRKGTTPRTRGSASKQKTPSTPASAKRAKKAPGKYAEDDADIMKTRMDTVWETLRKATDEEGRQYSALFFRLPSKKTYPDYYRVIAKPIDMKTIKSRHGKYANLEEFVADFDLMWANAQEFNMPDSQVYNDAVYLQELFRKEVKKVFEAQPPSYPSSPAMVTSPSTTTPPRSRRTSQPPSSDEEDSPPAKRSRSSRSILDDEDDDYDSQDDS